VLQISKRIIEQYSRRLEHYPHHFSEVLATQPPVNGTEDELIHTLAPNFVKGYINAINCEFVANPQFNPDLIMPQFDINLENLLGNKR
jgi:hypothetical protein